MHVGMNIPREYFRPFAAAAARTFEDAPWGGSAADGVWVIRVREQQSEESRRMLGVLRGRLLVLGWGSILEL